MTSSGLARALIKGAAGVACVASLAACGNTDEREATYLANLRAAQPSQVDVADESLLRIGYTMCDFAEEQIPLEYIIAALIDEGGLDLMLATGFVAFAISDLCPEYAGYYE